MSTVPLMRSICMQSDSKLCGMLDNVCVAAKSSPTALGLLTIQFSGLVVYEFVMTLDQELAAIWKRKFTATSLLLLGIRWLMLLNSILAAMPVGQAWRESSGISQE